MKIGMPMKLFKKLHRTTGGGAGAPSPTAEISSCSPSDQQDQQLSPSCPDTTSSTIATTISSSSSNNNNCDSKARESDFITSEEEFQMQLALALSASSNSNDPDGDQIRAATLLSLGRSGIGGGDQRRAGRRDEACGVPAESLSRRYWEYNVLDYDEKVVDGFYDIFGTSNTSGSHGRFPQLLDVQTSIGDLGFEVILVSRAIDPDLVELEQIAQCILMGFSSTEVDLWVQKLAELVTDHMGGPVKDANDILARWMERSTELRSSRQTSLLPIGCIKIGLSRHRALLFKVLADTVGIPCRLVKGSHYTGVDDDAVNIIKLDGEREFLVDLMADPGTLIPADVLSAKDGHLNSYTSRLGKDINPMEADTSRDVVSIAEQHTGYKGGNRTPILDERKLIEKRLRHEKGVVLPTIPSSSINIGSSSAWGTSNQSSNNQSSNLPFSVGSPVKEKLVLENGLDGHNMKSDSLSVVPNAQDNADTMDLFSDLNPFHVIGAGKASNQFKITAKRNSEHQRHRENSAVAPGRPQYPLVWKNRPACNDAPTAKQYNLEESFIPRKNILMKDHNPSTSRISPAWKACTEVGPSMYGMTDNCASNIDSSFGDSNTSNAIGRNPVFDLDTVGRDSRHDNTSVSFQLSAKYKPENKAQGLGRQDGKMHELKGHERKVKGENDRRKCMYDRFEGPELSSKDLEFFCSTSPTISSKLDPMLDDVAAWEIPWEDLLIGERIGLGSYGEVYRADWSGTEVAVKKFLDQDFYGDALDEFRSEVRIMRRLRHPNVVLFMGAVTRPPNLSIVSEFLPRGSLYRILHRPICQIDETRRIKMALDVAKGMNCLHTSTPTIVHRDLKSPNLLVDKNWTVKVCDFGLSRLKHSTFLSSKSTAGTPEWMAPEVLRNEPSNEKCDVYSFGVILWELATLRMPWSGMNPMQVVGAVGFRDRRLEIPKDVDPLVSGIILECWQSDPNLRPSFAELATALNSLQRLVIPSHQDVQNHPIPQEISVNSIP